jgi:V/A-type H+-transporting ATPase subunit K
MFMSFARRCIAAATLLTLLIGTGALAVWLLSTPAMAQGVPATLDPGLVRWAFASAAAAAGLATLAAGYAVATVGTAAVGALAEKPELFGRLLVLVGLAEGIAIYGLIVAVLIFNRVS